MIEKIYLHINPLIHNVIILRFLKKVFTSNVLVSTNGINCTQNMYMYIDFHKNQNLLSHIYSHLIVWSGLKVWSSLHNIEIVFYFTLWLPLLYLINDILQQNGKKDKCLWQFTSCVIMMRITNIRKQFLYITIALTEAYIDVLYAVILCWRGEGVNYLCDHCSCIFHR